MVPPLWEGTLLLFNLWTHGLFTSTLLKVVGYYDLSVLSMSVMGFQKERKVWMGGGLAGGMSSIQFFWIFEFF